MSRRLQIRFGFGTGPHVSAIGAGALLAGVTGYDKAAQRFPTPGLQDVLDGARAVRDARRENRDEKPAQAKLRSLVLQGSRNLLARTADGKSAFRERLMWFWGDHFTVSASNLPARAGVPAYFDGAIRPHVGGRFTDMLKAALTHPSMLLYLNQSSSFGPNSAVGRRRGRGLNENLAREVLELHTLGVGASYSQDDVRQLAELMTGLTFNLSRGFHYRADMAEPGAEVVLGRAYGGREGRLEDVFQALDDLAMHDDTVTHIATKLAHHFISDTPDRDLIEDLAEAYRSGDGALVPVYDVLLQHSSTTERFGEKAKTPFDFLMSALIGLGARSDDIAGLSPKDLRQGLFRPLEAMGQPLFRAPGPNGWPEEADHWIAPQGLATRILWSLRAAERLSDRLLEPRLILDEALGDLASPELSFAVSAAETRPDAVALILASAEFNRR